MNQYQDTAHYRYEMAKCDLSKEDLLAAYPTGEADSDYDGYPRVVVEDWGPVVEKATGEKTGMCRRIEGRTLDNILSQLNDHLDNEGLDVDEYFTVRAGLGIERWPDNVAQVMVYAVEGGSEGHYVHVDVFTSDKNYRTKTISLFLLKTFRGMRHALRLSNALTRAFYR